MAPSPLGVRLGPQTPTKKQLKRWGVKYHGLYFAKPAFDVYVDDKISSNQHSLSYSLQFFSNEKTLKDKEVDEAIDNAILHYAVFHFPITNDIVNETIPIAVFSALDVSGFLYLPL